MRVSNQGWADPPHTNTDTYDRDATYTEHLNIIFRITQNSICCNFTIAQQSELVVLKGITCTTYDMTALCCVLSLPHDV